MSGRPVSATDRSQIWDTGNTDRQDRKHYPWHRWLDGRTWELTIGVDFTGDLGAFRTACHKYAGHNGLRMRTHVAGSLLYIQALGEQGQILPEPPEGYLDS